MSNKDRLAPPLTWFDRLYRLYELVSQFWVLVTSLTGAGFLTYMGFISEWARSYGPILYAALFIGCFSALFLIFSVCKFLLSAAGEKNARQEAFHVWQKMTDSINPLEAEFSKRRMRLSDLSGPLQMPILRKKFIDCEIIGPGVLYFDGANGRVDLHSVQFYNCNVVILTEKPIRVYGTSVMSDIYMHNCRLFDITILAPRSMLQQMRAMNMNIISISGDEQIDGAAASSTSPSAT